MKTEKCPECGETTVVKERISLNNFSGKKDSEERTFLCGKSITCHSQYREEPRYACEKSKEYLDFIKKRNQVANEIDVFLLRKGLRSSFASEMKRHVEHDLRKEHFLPEADEDTGNAHQFDGHGCP